MTARDAEGLLHRVRQKLSRYEKAERWYDYPRWIDVVLETNGEFNMSSHTQAQAYRLTDSELQVQKDVQTMNDRGWKNYDLSRVVKAEVRGGETIVPERDYNAA